MKLKVGDIVELKNNETASIPEDEFPKYAKVSGIAEGIENDLYFSIEDSKYGFSEKSVAKVISSKKG